MNALRGTVVLDIGYTHSKAILFDSRLQVVDQLEVASRHTNDRYLALDPEPFLERAQTAIVQFDDQMPVDRIVSTAHGSGLALVDATGDLVLPMMDYAAQSPAEIGDAYRQIAPPFAETFAPVLPGALTLGLQLYWQSRAFPSAFGQVQSIMPTAQYAAFKLGGRRTTEITTLGAQSQLLDVKSGSFSSIAREQGWERLFAPMTKAYEVAGHFTRRRLRGEGALLAGIHDSNANYLRYLASGRTEFTLLSTGTWIIGFTPGVDLTRIDPARDVVSNTDYLGRPVASCRFMGGKEFENGAAGANPKASDPAVARSLIERGVMALPAFSDSGGPIPDCGNLGRIVNGPVESEAERASLMSIYCALMSWQSLSAVGGDTEVIVDGPFAKNDVYLGTLAELIAPRAMFASAIEQGTASGAALLAHCDADGRLPEFPVELRRIRPLAASGLNAYAKTWLQRTEDQSAQK